MVIPSDETKWIAQHRAEARAVARELERAALEPGQVLIEEPDPFDYDRLYGQEKYSLQNMLIRSWRMPHRVHRDQVGDVWSDRCHEAVVAAHERVVVPSKARKGGGDACDWFRECNGGEFLAYAQVLSDMNGGKQRVKGAMMVRFTNMASGYPTYRWTFHYAKSEAA